MIKYFDKVLIILGAVIIAGAVYMKSSVESYKNNLVDTYNKYEETMKNIASEDTLDNMKEEINSKINIPADIENLLGVVYIPKIDLSVTVAEGTDNETLKYSVGHFEETALPGEKGNCCIVGHRSYTYGEYFNRLDEIKIGDEIIIKRNNNTYTYKVNEIKVVEPEEIWVLDQGNDKEITLITCTPVRIATHRLIIKGLMK